MTRIEKENYIKDNYSTTGVRHCMEYCDLTNPQVYYLVKKYKLKITKDAASHNAKTRLLKIEQDHNVDPRPFIEVSDPKIAYILGLLWTDGHVAKKTNDIIFSTTELDRDEFLPIFKETGKWAVYEYPSKNQWKRKVTIMTTNSFLKDCLVELNFHNKELGIEKVLKHIPENLHHFFILGMVDGDGCFSVQSEKSRYRFNICSSLNQIWTSLEEICTNLGITYRIERTQTSKGNYSKLHIGGKFRVKAIGDYIYQGHKEHPYGLDRKYQKYLITKNNCITKRSLKH